MAKSPALGVHRDDRLALDREADGGNLPCPGRGDGLTHSLHRPGPGARAMSCSAQPGWGRSTAYSRPALASRVPSSRKRTALQAVVPTSSPRSCAMATSQRPWSSAARYITSMRSAETSGWML